MQLVACDSSGGDNGVRTHDLRLAKPALSQLSYVPKALSLTYIIIAPAATRLTLGRLLSEKVGGPDKVRTCDLPVISRTL